MIAFRELRADEWERLRPIYEENGDTLPSPESNAAFIAEADGKIIGLFGLNLVAHAGPVWVDAEWRGKRIADEMAQQLMKAAEAAGAKGFLMFPSNPQSESLAKRMGLVPVAVKVYKREF